MALKEIETKIRELLATETSPWVLSDKLFGSGGLFAQLGPTLEDRRRVGGNPLFKEAQKRIRALEHHHAKVLRDELGKLPLSVARAKGA